MGRPPCRNKANLKKGPWTPEEDAKLLAYTSSLISSDDWTAVPQRAGLERCGRSCKLRYINYLRPDLEREGFTQQEDELIVALHSMLGSRWSLIAEQLPGRTDDNVKNYWNTKLSKKLRQRGIDPITHRPIADLLQSIGTLAIRRTATPVAPKDAGLSAADAVAIMASTNEPSADVANRAIPNIVPAQLHKYAKDNENTMKAVEELAERQKKLEEYQVCIEQKINEQNNLLAQILAQFKAPASTSGSALPPSTT